MSMIGDIGRTMTAAGTAIADTARDAGTNGQAAIRGGAATAGAFVENTRDQEATLIEAATDAFADVVETGASSDLIDLYFGPTAATLTRDVANTGARLVREGGQLAGDGYRFQGDVERQAIRLGGEAGAVAIGVEADMHAAHGETLAELGRALTRLDPV